MARPFKVGVTATVLALAAGAAMAQGQPDASPLAPETMKKPLFDTSTPVFDPSRIKQDSASSVVAEVDGRVVTMGEVGDVIAELPAGVRGLPFSELFPSVLEQLVRQQALVIQAQREGLDDDPTIRRKVKEAGEKVLAAEAVRAQAIRQITEAMLLARYDRDMAGKPGPEQVKLRVIMVGTEAEAKAAIGQLQGGADFGTVAQAISKDTTAPAGGNLGYVTRDGLNAEVGAAAFLLKPGQVTPYPVYSAGAWFVAEVEDRRVGPTPPFAAVREQLLGGMIRERAPDAVKAALTNATVRTYTVAGKTASDASSASGND